VSAAADSAQRKQITVIASKFSNGRQRRKSMSALNIIIGGWLALNAVLFAALMLRRDQPALRDQLLRWVVGDEVSDRRGDLAAMGACSRERSRDVAGHVAGPALGGVESDDADWRPILVLEQEAGQRSAVGIGPVGLAPGTAEPVAEVIEHEMDISTSGTIEGEVLVVRSRVSTRAPDKGGHR
jgi:hypothetical protein